MHFNKQHTDNRLALTFVRFNTSGDRLDYYPDEIAAFYGLEVNGLLVDYFTSFRALTFAIEELKQVNVSDCKDAA